MTPPLLLLLLLFCFLSGSRAQSNNPTELQILLDLKASIGINNATQGFETWTKTTSPCSFSGITCDATGSVSKLQLNNRGISGTPSFHSLCQLPALTEISFGSNKLYGTVTADLRNCNNLLFLDLAENSFSGAVPDLSPLHKLRGLNLSGNGFSGMFPWSSIGNLTDLGYLKLGDNPFDPTPFPEEILNLTSLYSLYLSNSSIQGPIPPSVGNLINLVNLELADNNMSGDIPPEITRLKNLRQLELYNNSITGKLPDGFRNFSELQFFDASMNYLEGDLSVLRFLTNLVSLQLFYNSFTGEIPAEFGDFKNLVNLSLYSNMLSGPLPERLGSWSEFNFIDVSTNRLTGSIPPDMCRRGTMKLLLMLENQFDGQIPATYGNCSSLVRFRVNNNSLTGEVPSRIWGLPNAEIIDVSINQLSGPVTADIGNAMRLSQLFIFDNQFSGELPPEISNVSALVSIDARSNKFSGLIPSSVGELKKLNSLFLQDNEFSGDIPVSLASCTSLNVINIAGNSLSGNIPASIGQLRDVNSLNLSDNQLSGAIPASLSSLKLSVLDLSNNRLTGELPQALSIDAYSQSFTGNPGLCGLHAQFLRSCSGNSRNNRFRALVSTLLVISTLLVACVGCLLFLKKRRSCRSISKESWDMKSFRILSFDEQEIINAIKQENVIGKGGSGSVYRVELGNGKTVAVKHIWNYTDPGNAAWGGGGGKVSATSSLMTTRRSSSLASREFEAEASTLSSIRHVNVVKLYCSITSEDSSLLVYEYLPNGSLWDRLHTCRGKLELDWDTRYDVAVGAARGLEYLHHGCERPILHRDVKSSNILLDEAFKPRIADFGLAKILQACTGKESSAQVIAGTHGYIAPEYAYTCKVNEKSDVYSFGVVLMELVTGRRPIEPEYGDNKDIVYWVCRQMTSRESVLDTVDAAIPQALKEEAVKVLKIAVLCTVRLPSLRPSMRSVVQMLEEAGRCRFPAVIIDVKDQKGGEEYNKFGGKNDMFKASP